MRIAILQPTFLPWIGWFDLADQADLLILLDDVSFSKQSWQQRNRIRTPDGLSYLSLSVRTAGKLGQSILSTELADTRTVEKISRTIAGNYARAPYFEQYWPELDDVLIAGGATGRLCELNCAAIDWLAARLGITTAQVRASSVPVSGKRGEYVAGLCAHFGASQYLSPAGAEEYLREDADEFRRRGVTVQLHAYDHPVYRQCFQPFVPYASAVDLLMNEGPAAGDILRSGRRPARLLESTMSVLNPGGRV